MDKQGWVLGKELARQARVRPDAPFMQFRDEAPVTFAQADQQANRIANGLRSLGVAQGDKVAVMLSNSPDYLHTWAGIGRLGAVHVAINTAYKGQFLSHVLNNSEARIMILEAAYLDWLRGIEDQLPLLETVLVAGIPSHETPLKRARILPFASLLGAGADPPAVRVAYSDLGVIMYTSGTTGPSKGVLMSHAHLYLFALGAMEALRISQEDTYYICMPLFHANALLMQLYPCLLAGCKAVISGSFSASGWLDDVIRYKATLTNTLGVMTEFIYRQPPRAEDSGHRLRRILAIPAPEEIAVDFMSRFGVPLEEGYGMTEVNIPLYTPLDEPYRPGSCGKVLDKYFEVRIVDPETDEALERGFMGEIVVRPREAFAFMQGYNAMPEKTVEAWRNLWFHTGDAGRQDEDGYFYFVDRINDCIRRRGENISSYEVEAVIAQYPAVEEVAVIAVKSTLAGGEDEIKICVVPRPGQSISPEALLDHCVAGMPRFSVPRYVEFVQALPKTPTAKVQKAKLREIGINATTWDREAAGYIVPR